MAQLILQLGKCEDLTGRTFDRLTVLRFVGKDAKYQTFWECRCACGRTRIVQGVCLTNKRTKSCGCLQREVTSARLTTHGETGSAEHWAWRNMQSRCDSDRPRVRVIYKDRGIKVCERWLGRKGFAAFLADMGSRPSSNHSVDRIDNDKGYWCGKPECPECGPLGREPNCRWATTGQQARNKRSNHLITFEGETLTVTDWAKRKGLRYLQIIWRLNHNWPVERALNTPTVPRKECGKTHTALRRAGGNVA